MKSAVVPSLTPVLLLHILLRSVAANRCSTGSWGESSEYVDLCRPCSTGHYCPIDTIFRHGTLYKACPRGTYLSYTGASSYRECLNCHLGTYARHTGRAGCTKCPRGTYCDVKGLTHAKPCPPGTYCDVKGLNHAKPCPPGTYQPQKGAISSSACRTCPAGTLHPQSGGHKCYPCPDGYTCADTAPISTSTTSSTSNSSSTAVSSTSTSRVTTNPLTLPTVMPTQTIAGVTTTQSTTGFFSIITVTTSLSTLITTSSTITTASQILSTTTTQPILNDYYIQFSLTLNVSNENISDVQLVTQLMSIFITALDTTSNQLDITIPASDSRTTRRVVAQVRFFSTATESADDLLIRIRSQLADSSSEIRRDSLTSQLSPNSIENVKRYYTCSNGVLQELPCSTSDVSKSGLSLTVILLASIIPSVFGLILLVAVGFMLIKYLRGPSLKPRIFRFDRL